MGWFRQAAKAMKAHLKEEEKFILIKFTGLPNFYQATFRYAALRDKL